MKIEGFTNKKEENKQKILPKENTLPLNTKLIEKNSEGRESNVYKTTVETGKSEEVLALKEIRREAFASDEEMHKSQKFYEFLKTYPEFGRFVPDTLYFKAKTTPDSKPQAFCLQKFIDGNRIDKLTDEELYKDPSVVKQLLDFIDAATKILQTTLDNNTYKPDFMRTTGSGKPQVILGATLGNPRYSSNIILSKTPDKNGQRIFFVDTGVNADERTREIRRLFDRYTMSPLHKMQFERWKKKLESIQNN